MLISLLPVHFHEGLNKLHERVPGPLFELLPALATLPLLFGLVCPVGVYLVFPFSLRIRSWKTKT